MKRLLSIAILALGFINCYALEPSLSVKWEELTASDFVKAVEQSKGVCVIPIGVIEKHGPHMPLFTDCYIADYVSKLAAEKEYALVFPTYYVGQISEARHQPGTVAYSPELCMKMLDETCAEIARNGLKKIILFNIHGGNNAMLQYFCQNQLYKEKDYVVYWVTSKYDDRLNAELEKRLKNKVGPHAGERETSEMIYIRPELVQMGKVNSENGESLRRLDIGNLTAGISWYAEYPNHYAGNAVYANAELGELCCREEARILSEKIKTVKADKVAPALQSEFFNKSKNPITTEQ